MGYQSDNTGRHMDVDDVELHPSGQETTNGSGASVEVDRGVARLTLDVTAVGADADETLDVSVETSEDDATWREVGTFTQYTQPDGVGSERLSFAGLDRFVRVSWTVGGTTPEFTFEVSGEVA